MEYTVSYYIMGGADESQTFNTRSEALEFIHSFSNRGFYLMYITATQTVRTTVDITLDDLNSYAAIVDKFAHI